MLSYDKKGADGTLKIAICDDDLPYGRHVLDEVKQILDTHHIAHILSIFRSGENLLDAGFFDIIILDIEMDGLSGIETAEQLRLQNNSSRIIFLTSHEKYVFSAFDVAASHYLLKPLDPQRLEQVLMKLVNGLATEMERCYTVKCGTQIYRVPFAQIMFIEIFGRTIILHTTQEVLTFNGRLEELEQAFPKQFFRCHKSYLVNLAMVRKYNRDAAVLQGEATVPIARRKFAEFGAVFLAFLQEDGDTI